MSEITGAMKHGDEQRHGLLDPLKLTYEQRLMIAQQCYQQQGYLVFAFDFPKQIGERVAVGDDALNPFLWRVMGKATRQELIAQWSAFGLIPHQCVLDRPFFYRAEVMD